MHVETIPHSRPWMYFTVGGYHKHNPHYIPTIIPNIYIYILYIKYIYIYIHTHPLFINILLHLFSWIWDPICPDLVEAKSKTRNPFDWKFVWFTEDPWDPIGFWSISSLNQSSKGVIELDLGRSSTLRLLEVTPRAAKIGQQRFLGLLGTDFLGSTAKGKDDTILT